MNEQPTIFIVDDDERVRAMLISMLESKRYQTEAYDSARQFIDDYDPDRSGCLLLDINMPEMSGLELQGELNRRSIEIPIVFITGIGDVSKSVRALKAGAVDFLEKPFRRDVLLQSIEQALEKDQHKRAEKAAVESIRSRFARLTDRELEVLNHLISGVGNLSNKQIARELGISHRTIDHHRSRIMDKTGASSITELTLLASQAGLRSSHSK